MNSSSSLDEAKSNQRKLTDEISEIIDKYLEYFAVSHALPEKITRHFPVFAQCIKSIIFYGKISLFQRCFDEFIVQRMIELQRFPPDKLNLEEFESLFKRFEWLVCTLAAEDEFEILNFLLEEKATGHYLLKSIEKHSLS